MYIIRMLRSAAMKRAIDGRRLMYQQALDPEDRLAWQLAAFNREWGVIRRTVPFYRELADAKRLGEAFESWPHVISALPVLSRGMVQEHKSRLHSEARPGQWQRTTGGSSASPVQLPAWNSEIAATSPDTWMARGWYGVRVHDRMFLLWGQSHLLGTGFRGRIRGWDRKVRDSLLGYCRHSAYDLSEEGLRKGGERLIRFRPSYILGYSVALDLFARANLDRAEAFRALRLKAVIGAAEGFPRPDSAGMISGLFGAPLGMEYGSVETNLIGHTTPKGPYNVFWRTYFVEATDDGPNGGRIVRVTSLFPRCTPLVRYELGDEVELLEGDDGNGITRFARVGGRCNTFLLLQDGSRVHSEAITHCVRACPEIQSYQAQQQGSAITICYTAPAPLPAATAEAIRGRLAKIHPLLSAARIEHVRMLKQTVSGKTPMILRT
ncbi:MAG: hypothetical protein ACE15C_11595 [Phycisphaerae bacterium]